MIYFNSVRLCPQHYTTPALSKVTRDLHLLNPMVSFQLPSFLPHPQPKWSRLPWNTHSSQGHPFLSVFFFPQWIFFLFLIFNLLIIRKEGGEEREREKHGFVFPFIFAFTGYFLHVPWQGIKPTTLGCQDNILTELPSQGPLNGFFSHLPSFLKCPGTSLFLLLLLLPLLRLYLFFRARGREGERGIETLMCEGNINQLPLTHPQVETWPATQAWALDQELNLQCSVHSLALNPLSHTSQGKEPVLNLFFCLYVLLWLMPLSDPMPNFNLI